MLQQSPPEYRYSLYHSIDSFWLAFNMQDFSAAELQIQEASVRGANNFTLTELKALLFFSKGQFKEAIEIFEKAITLRPNTALLYNLALSYLNFGDLNKSESILNKMLIIIPNNYRAIRLQANIWLLQGNIDSSIRAYEKIVDSTDNSKDFTNLSLAYGLNRQYIKSLKFAKKALEKSPNQPLNILNLADIEMIIGNKEIAIIHYQKVVDILIGKNEVKYLSNLAQAYGHLGRADLSIAALNKAQVLAPDSGEVSYSSAIVYSLLKEKSSTIHHVKLALKNNVGVIWFNLPWFDKLCSNKDFKLLMLEYNNLERCEI